MNAQPAPLAGDDSSWAPLIEVSDLPIAELLTDGNPRLMSSMRRVTRELTDPNGVIAAFSSYAASRD